MIKESGPLLASTVMLIVFQVKPDDLMQARGAVAWLVWNEPVSARETNSFHKAPLRMFPLILAHWLMQRTVPARVKTSTHRRHHARHKKAAAKVGIRMAQRERPACLRELGRRRLLCGVSDPYGLLIADGKTMFHVKR